MTVRVCVYIALGLVPHPNQQHFDHSTSPTTNIFRSTHWTDPNSGGLHEMCFIFAGASRVLMWCIYGAERQSFYAFSSLGALKIDDSCERKQPTLPRIRRFCFSRFDLLVSLRFFFWSSSFRLSVFVFMHFIPFICFNKRRCLILWPLSCMLYYTSSCNIFSRIINVLFGENLRCSAWSS